jgi:hypothetical protein
MGGFAWRACAELGALGIDLEEITGLPVPVRLDTGPLGIVLTPEHGIRLDDGPGRPPIEPTLDDISGKVSNTALGLPERTLDDISESRACRALAETIWHIFWQATSGGGPGELFCLVACQVWPDDGMWLGLHSRSHASPT